MNKLIPLLLLILSFQSWSQEYEQSEESIVATSCSLSVKTTVFKADQADLMGKASIEATLCDKAGTPIPDQTITMTSTTGTFTCIPPEAINRTYASDHSCLLTGPDGKTLIYLVDIPFNKPGRVKATCTYGDFTVHASGSYSITRNVFRKKGGKNIKSASPPDR
jgi:hypothetical protein